MKLPNDPIMLLSVVNTALRDQYSSWDDMAHSENIDADGVVNKLEQIGYSYNRGINQFV
jgi:hypothetical protein